MMSNLFSVFDPSSSIFKMSWLVMFASTSMISVTMWKTKNPLNKTFKKIVATLKKEVSFSLGKTEKGTELMIMMAFVSILIMNFLALYPQIFSPTSHLTITLPMSLIFWTTVMMFGWVKNTKHMLAHLLPQGTPSMLMNFMVAIELTSNIIRPITLCVRLTANLIAGHLLMTLLGNTLVSLTPFVSTMYLMAPLILTILESAVACIQAYVFMTLITLYTTELK